MLNGIIFVATVTMLRSELKELSFMSFISTMQNNITIQEPHINLLKCGTINMFKKIPKLFFQKIKNTTLRQGKSPFSSEYFTSQSIILKS
jgi:hypothetical protein